MVVSLPMRKESVLIVHGLWMHGAVFTLLRARLRREGFDAHTFSYSSVRRDFDEHLRALAERVQSLGGSRVHLIGHSLGGLLCIRYAASGSDTRLARIVLLGSPVRGSFVAKRLAERAFGRQLLGEARAVLINGIPEAPLQNVQVGVIAGSLGIGLGRVLAALPAPHDGTVAVEETRFPGVTDSLLLPVSHSGLVFSAEVAHEAASFLRYGRFSRSGAA